MEGLCFKGYSHLLQRGGEWKVFVVNRFHLYYKESVVNEFHFYYNESGMEGVCRKGVSHLLEREMTGRWMSFMRFTCVIRRQWKLFVVWEIHICYKEKSMHGSCLLYGRFTSVTRRKACTVFVIMELHIYYKEMRVEDMSYYNEIMVVVCYNGDSQLLQKEVQAMCLSYKSFTTVTIREEWKVGCEIRIY